MTRYVTGVMPYSFYDVPVKVEDEKGFVNGQVWLAYSVTEDNDSGGRFVDWEIESWDKLHIYDELGEKLPVENPRFIERQLEDFLVDEEAEDITYKAIEYSFQEM